MQRYMTHRVCDTSSLMRLLFVEDHIAFGFASQCTWAALREEAVLTAYGAAMNNWSASGNMMDVAWSRDLTDRQYVDEECLRYSRVVLLCCGWAST